MVFTREEMEYYHNIGLMPDWAYYQQADYLTPEQKLQAQTDKIYREAMAEKEAREKEKAAREAKRKQEKADKEAQRKQEKELEKQIDKALDIALDKALGDWLKGFPGTK